MEQMVVAELEKHRKYLEEKILQITAIPELQLQKILNEFELCYNSIVKLMKEGKAAHDKFFQDIILNSIDAIIGLDNDFKIFLWNKGAENIFEYKKKEVMGRDFDFLIPEDLRKKGEKKFLIDEVNRNGYLANYESQRLTKSGKTIDVSITRFAIYDENNKEQIGSVGILRDITKIKQLQRELREKENLALIGEVVSSIAHSLSNPLNIISGNADYLLMNKKPDDEGYQELKTIVEEATRITKSLRSILNFSRPIKTELVKTNLNEIIKEVVNNNKMLINGKNIKIEIKLENHLPAIYADKAQVYEAISNILINAVQAIDDKGIIRLTTNYDDKFVNAEITDNGTGIPNDIIDKIFKPFYSSKSYGKGTGLGLALTKRIMDEHKGKIKVKSEIKKGTVFTLSFPIRRI